MSGDSAEVRRPAHAIDCRHELASQNRLISLASPYHLIGPLSFDRDVFTHILAGPPVYPAGNLKSGAKNA
jgi:hypothetical protein